MSYLNDLLSRDDTPAVIAERPRRRVRGLKLMAVPSLPLLAQVGGGAVALYGMYLTVGTGIALIVGGLAATALGMLREGGKI